MEDNRTLSDLQLLHGSEDQDRESKENLHFLFHMKKKNRYCEQCKASFSKHGEKCRSRKWPLSAGGLDPGKGLSQLSMIDPVLWSHAQDTRPL